MSGLTDVAEIDRAIQLAIAPAFLMTGVFGLITILANRLARLIDRERAVRAGTAAPQMDEQRFIALRARHLHRAIGSCVLAAFLLALLIVMSFVGILLQLNVAWVLAGLLVLAMVSMMIALLLLLMEIGLAFRHLPLAHDV
ncbi:DUF2721 domain-containing protein [Roseicella aquatilis]|uniref:DUF2721 domain-containing protein n=1 Tax=Roseicella aquatilis TaxID=2527868 RepID=A0A4R4DUD1_9PROT|nr:DUF2721 domain-containing protein [Roseicella aquatilis]TCZ66624.1 DUF2721 domain-containing protein [Roseicella aquatilis]